MMMSDCVETDLINWHQCFLNKISETDPLVLLLFGWLYILVARCASLPSVVFLFIKSKDSADFNYWILNFYLLSII